MENFSHDLGRFTLPLLLIILAEPNLMVKIVCEVTIMEFLITSKGAININHIVNIYLAEVEEGERALIISLFFYC